MPAILLVYRLTPFHLALRRRGPLSRQIDVETLERMSGRQVDLFQERGISRVVVQAFQ